MWGSGLGLPRSPAPAWPWRSQEGRPPSRPPRPPPPSAGPVGPFADGLVLLRRVVLPATPLPPAPRPHCHLRVRLSPCAAGLPWTPALCVSRGPTRLGLGSEPPCSSPGDNLALQRSCLCCGRWGHEKVKGRVRSLLTKDKFWLCWKISIPPGASLWGWGPIPSRAGVLWTGCV